MSVHPSIVARWAFLSLLVWMVADPGPALARVRKSYVNLTAAESQAFVDACIALKAVDPGGINGGLLGYDDFVRMHDDYASEAHAHQQMAKGPAFLAWHRQFLLRFEDALRSVNGGQFANVTVPYWDWTVDPFPTSLVGGDGDPVTNDVTTGPFAHSTGNWTLLVNPTNGPELQRDFQSPLPQAPIPAGDVVAALQLPIFDAAPWNRSSNISTSFRNKLEGWVPGQQTSALHNRVHVRIKGNMLDPGSAVNDPVFWLNHANVDRIWCKWQEAYPTYLHHMPQTGADAGQNALDLMVPFLVTPAATTNMIALGYEYDDPAGGENCTGPCVYTSGPWMGRTYSQVMMEEFL